MDVVTAAIGNLLPKLGELLVGGYKLLKDLKEDVEFLEMEMRSMNVVLNRVAEVPRDQLDHQVIVWADELRELSYNMEDVVDNFLVCVEGSESDAAIADSYKLTRLMVKMANLFTEGKTRHQIANAIKEIRKRAQEVRYLVDNAVANDDDVANDDAVANEAGKVKVDPRVLALYKDQKELVGIEDARKKLTKRLTDGPKQQQHKMKIVSIVGPGGLGKTTLARAVYDRLQTQFEYTAFVLVGQNPQVKKVLRDILLEVDKNERMGDVATLDEGQLVEKLRRRLENGRYLIVFDDIWDLIAWQIIKHAFVDNNHGSRVITTTRILDVATITGDIYKLEPLSQHLSEELFYTRLFGGKDKCPFDQPAKVSNKILQKCGGVTLAIITLASLLADKPMEDWSKVFNSFGFGSRDKNKAVENTRKILSFSYYDLPCHLRSCLLHMSVYPKDYLIMKDTLIWQWVAEGFISEEPGVSLFETGERYFYELLNRNMIQPVVEPEKYIIYACRIHDMVLDMICLLSKEQNFVTILDSNEEHTPSQCNARRIAVQKRDVPRANMSMPKLRSCYATMCDPNAVPSLSNFQVLRVLAMQKCSFKRDRPCQLEHFGRLPQLRYLSLEGTHISKLPQEIGDLKFLQTLDLRNTHIKELPQSIGLLRNLKCLRADTNAAGITMSNWIGNLTSLEELHLNTADESCIFVKELSKLTELRVLICNLTIDMDEWWDKLFVESLCNLRKIQVLRLSCFRWPRLDVDAHWKGYKPPWHLRDLDILCGFSRLPAWINSSLLPNLSSLNIDVTVDDLGEQDVVNLGSLRELTWLGELNIQGGMEFPDGAFPKLRSCTVYAPFKFLQGSMQSLEKIDIIVEVRALKDASTDFDFIGSLGNLPSLRTVFAKFNVNNAYTSDFEYVMAAVRQAIDTHPNRPTLNLQTFGNYWTDEEESGGYCDIPQAGYLDCSSHTTTGQKRSHCEAMEPTCLPMVLLQKITNNFSEERLLGQGTYGKVYKGVHDDKQEIAVKLLYNNLQIIDDEQFKREFDNLIMLKHPNIVQLVGYCYETQRRHMNFQGSIVFGETTHKALCFEYMPKGSLQKHLSDECSGLDWQPRYKIIKGACEGLKYLHEDLENPFYHLDLKPDNILLDENMVAKLADFGLSKFCGDEQTRMTQNRIGTIGYMPREYLLGGVVSNKFDIFSLGVVMTKIIAGPEGPTLYYEMKQEFLYHVQEKWRERLQVTWSSPEPLEAQCQQVKKCTEIALRCMDDDRHKRPSIVDIIHELNKTETFIEKVTNYGQDPSSPLASTSNGVQPSA